MYRTVYALAIAAGLTAGIAACSTEPKSDSDKQTLHEEVQSTLTAFRNDDPTLNDLLAKSVGYAVFPDVGKAGLGVGGSYGRGEVFENGRRIGYADLTKGTIGLQIGAQTFDELLVFLTQEQLDDFKGGEFKFSADASAVAIKSGAAASADPAKGVVVFVRTTGGLMAEASIGGQNFTFKPL